MINFRYNWTANFCDGLFDCDKWYDTEDSDVWCDAEENTKIDIMFVCHSLGYRNLHYITNIRNIM